MQKVYLLKENGRLRRALGKSGSAFTKAAQTLRPKLKELTEDEVMSQAQDCHALIESGYLKIEWLEGFDERCLVLTIREEK